MIRSHHTLTRTEQQERWFFAGGDANVTAEWFLRKQAILVTQRSNRAPRHIWSPAAAEKPHCVYLQVS